MRNDKASRIRRRLDSLIKSKGSIRNDEGFSPLSLLSLSLPLLRHTPSDSFSSSTLSLFRSPVPSTRLESPTFSRTLVGKREGEKDREKRDPWAGEGRDEIEGEREGARKGKEEGRGRN